MHQFAREVRHAARRLLAVPSFAAASTLTIALAIGANGAIFAVVHRVVLNPLPYGDSGRLLAVDFAIPSRNIPAGIAMPTRLYYHYLDRARTISGLAFYRRQEMTLSGRGAPERIGGVLTAPSLASVLRVAPAQGRWFTDDEGTPGAAGVAVISHGTWTRSFGADPDVLGKQLTLDGEPRTIVGVMPATFVIPDPAVDVWVPMPLTRASASDAYMVALVARLRDGATVAEARREFDRLTLELDAAYPGNGYRELSSRATTLIDARVGAISSTLWILLTAVGVVLLVACANAANLFLIRAERYHREVAVRRALGATSRAIARYLLSETAVICATAAAVGLLIAWGAVRLLVAFGPANLPRIEEVQLDGVAVGFIAGLSLLTTFILGAIPFAHFRRIQLSPREMGRTATAGRGRQRARHMLVAAQIALAVVLVSSAGLMLRSLESLRAVDPGFDPASALKFRIGLPSADYPDAPRMVAAHRAILDRLSALPGVRAVSASTCLPLDGCQGGPLFVEGRALASGVVPPIVLYQGVAAAFFETMGTPIRQGRGITQDDVERSEPVAVINEALARVALLDENPLGQRVRLGNPAVAGSSQRWHTVVGVVANTPTTGLAERTPVPRLYLPLAVQPPGNLSPRYTAANYVVRTDVAPLTLVDATRAAVGEVDATLALGQVGTLQEVLDAAASRAAFMAGLVAIAAAVALVLGMIGIYGAMSYAVSQRTAEIGVRLAVGAAPASIARLIVGQGALLATAGIATGLALALASGRAIESVLFGVSPRDPGIFAATTLLLLLIALYACWLPARRAARLDPVAALRVN